jgi:hypothetical protein
VGRAAARKIFLMHRRGAQKEQAKQADARARRAYPQAIHRLFTGLCTVSAPTNGNRHVAVMRQTFIGAATQ